MSKTGPVLTPDMPGPTRPAFPFLDLNAQYTSIAGEIREAIDRVMASQQFILGPEVAAFEQEIKFDVGCQFAVGCASGTDALLLALMAIGVGPGDEVIAPPFTFVATAGCIARLGAQVVFADIEQDTFNIDPRQIERLITKRTKAIIPVHIFGLPADMDSISSVAGDVAVIEDAAQAIGAQYKDRLVGSMGTMGCFSFFPSKNLGGAGDGGLVSTNDPEIADRLRTLRVHGSRNKYEYDMLGINSRLDSLQAAILRVKLHHLESWERGRRRNAARYKELFLEYKLDGMVTTQASSKDSKHVYNQFTIRTAARDALRSHLTKMGIPTEIYYPYPLHLQPAFASLDYGRGDFPVSEALCAEVLSLPIFPELTDEYLLRVVEAIASFFRH